MGEILNSAISIILTIVNLIPSVSIDNNYLLLKETYEPNIHQVSNIQDVNVEEYNNMVKYYNNLQNYNPIPLQDEVLRKKYLIKVFQENQ